MTTQQIRTVKRLGVALGLFVVLVLWLLYTEGAAIVQGGHSTITEVVQLGWAHQPWVFLLLAVLLVAIVAFLAGHFFAAPESHYERLRGGALQEQEGAPAEALDVRIDYDQKWLMGVNVLDAKTGLPLSDVVASDEQMAAIKALRVGDVTSIQQLATDEKGEHYLVWSDGTRFDPKADPDRCTRRYLPGSLRTTPGGATYREKIAQKAEPDPVPATFWCHVRRVA